MKMLPQVTNDDIVPGRKLYCIEIHRDMPDHEKFLHWIGKSFTVVKRGPMGIDVDVVALSPDGGEHIYPLCAFNGERSIMICTPETSFTEKEWFAYKLSGKLP